VQVQDQLYRGLEAALDTTFSSEPLAPPPQPMILVISGPSGVGKDAVIKVMPWELCALHLMPF
jgi:guanylate kinase